MTDISEQSALELAGYLDRGAGSPTLRSVYLGQMNAECRVLDAAAKLRAQAAEINRLTAALEMIRDSRTQVVRVADAREMARKTLEGDNHE